MSETHVTLAEVAEVVPPRPRGRPPGSGNKSLCTEKRIRQHNNARSFVDRVVKGGKIKAALTTGGKVREWQYPTVQQRIKCAEIQLRDASTLEAINNGIPIGPAAIINIQIVNAVSP